MIAAIFSGGPDDGVRCEVWPRDKLAYVPFLGPILPWSDHIGPGKLVYAETDRFVDGCRVFEYVKAAPTFAPVRYGARGLPLHHDADLANASTHA